MTPTYAIILALLHCLNGERDVCDPAVEAARNNPDLGYLVALIEEQA